MSDEQAKTPAEIIKAAGGVGSYLAHILGSVPDNLLGLGVGDWLHHKRKRHLAILGQNIRWLLEIRETERITEPNPAVLIPLLQAAADEAEEELQAMWAGLLANAMLDGGRRVRADYIEVLRKLAPRDASVLGGLSEAECKKATPPPFAGLPPEEQISVEGLSRHGCVEVDDRGTVYTTAFGRGLLAACTLTPTKQA